MTLAISLLLTLLTFAFIVYPFFRQKSYSAAPVSAEKPRKTKRSAMTPKQPEAGAIVDDEIERMVRERRQSSRSSTRFCPRCGAEVKRGDRFCSSCGASLIEGKDGG